MILAVSFLVYIVATALMRLPILFNSKINFRSCRCWLSLFPFPFSFFPFTRVCSLCVCGLTSFPLISFC